MRLGKLQQCWHREDAATQVGAYWLTEPTRITNQIQHVINELERDSEVLSKFAKHIDVLVWQIRGERPSGRCPQAC